MVCECRRCESAIMVGEANVICQGFCTDAYHASCARLTEDVIAAFRHNCCIWWMCTSCGILMRQIRDNKEYKGKRSKIENDDVVPVLVDRRSELLEKDISILKEQMSSLQQSIADFERSRSVVSIDSVSGDRPLAQSSPEHLSSSRFLLGSKTFSSMGSSPSASHEKCWSFFTKIKHTVNEDQIRNMVSRSIGASNAIVKKLVSRWRDISTMPFISFKVGIDVGLKDMAMRSGICFREFHDNYELWEP